MPHVKRAFWTVATALTLTALVGFTSPASAQRAALTRDVDGPIRGIRHVESVSPNFSSGAFSLTEVVTPVVPANKRLFIQSVSMHTYLTDGQGPMESRVTIGSDLPIWVSQAFQAAGSVQRHFTGNQSIDTLLAPGESITIFVFRNDNLGSASLNFVRVTIRGYLVDATP
jgi:hypothetical protein